MTHINSINIDCLLLIFNFFSLNEQAYLRSICKKWKQIIEEALSPKKQLQIFPNQQSVDEFNTHCSLYLNDHQNKKSKNIIIGQNCQVVDVIFPAVTHLRVWFDYTNNYADLPDYLSQKSKTKTLEGISLCGYFKPNAQLCNRILKSINGLENLKRLDLKAKNLFTAENYRSLPIAISTEVIARLEHFSYADYFGDLKTIAVHFKKLRYLALEHENIVTQLPDMIAANPNLTTTVMYLYLSPSIGSKKQIIVSKFANLKNFSL